MPRIALGQLNLTVGDLAGNVVRMAEMADRATQGGADVIASPNWRSPATPPRTWCTVASSSTRASRRSSLARRRPRLPRDPGFVDRSDAGVHNAAALLRNGTVGTRYHKMQLPNFGVFDEQRYFVPGTEGVRVDVVGSRSGCRSARTPGTTPCRSRATRGVPLIVNINGSPYHRGKTSDADRDPGRERARQTGAWIAYVNAVGGQDELVFDGGSLVVAPDGDRAPSRDDRSPRTC